MVFYFLTRLFSVSYVFLYPGYGIFKTMTHRPQNAEEQQAQVAESKRWLEYCSVVSFLLAAEYVAEWLVSWFPGYCFFKSAFLLWLVAPQTQGASFIFQQILAPYLTKHEAEIDARLVNMYTSAITYLHDIITTTLPKVVPQQQPNQQANFAAGLMLSLLQQYAPSVAGGKHGSAPEEPNANAKAGFELRPELPVPVDPSLTARAVEVH